MSLCRRRLLVLPMLVFAAALAGAQETKLANLAGLKFTPVPGVTKCLSMSVVEGDPGKGPSTLVLRGTPGCDVPMHYHTANERVVLVTGSAYLQMQGQKEATLIKPGAYAMAPSKHPHHLTCTGGCQLYLFSNGTFDMHWVNAEGKEISLAEAEKASKKLGPPRKATKSTSAGD
jgi:quercetin dioxygenase-like cupin family protein